MFPVKNVFITGGAGFIGLHLARRLDDQQRRIVLIDNFSSSDRTAAEAFARGRKNVLLLDRDVSLPWSMWLKDVHAAWLEDLSHVFHLASPASPSAYRQLTLETLRVNTQGTDQALEFATRKGARLVFASSSEVYGCSEQVPFREDNWGRVNPQGMRSCYVEAKRLAESLVFHYNARFQTRHGTVRIFNTYGPEMKLDDGRVMINFLTQALAQKPLTVYGSGRQTRSFCYVDDMIDALLAYAEREISQPINLGNDAEVSILELIEHVSKVVGRSALEVRFLAAHDDDPPRRRPDLTLARTLLSPWQPRVGLELGVRRTWAWLKQSQTRSLAEASLGTWASLSE